MTKQRATVSDIGVVTALPLPPPGWFNHAHAVLPEGSLAIIRTSADLHDIYRNWHSAVQKAWTPPPAILEESIARISLFDGEHETEALSAPLGRHPIVSRWPDGRWIIAAARCNSDVRNARIFAPDGTPAGAIHVGDGIEHLLCGPDGTLWLGYFDEGVFGAVSFDDRAPLGNSGVANVSDRGDLLFGANTQEACFVDDCYALTLDEDTIWACTYYDFPILRIRNGAVTRWTNTLAGVRALAVDGDFILLFGGYNDDEARLSLLRLQGDAAVLVGEADLAGYCRETMWIAQGCGDTLHITSADSWRRIHVRDFAAYLEEHAP